MLRHQRLQLCRGCATVSQPMEWKPGCGGLFGS
jgi:hypothetical protein